MKRKNIYQVISTVIIVVIGCGCSLATAAIDRNTLNSNAPSSVPRK